MSRAGYARLASESDKNHPPVRWVIPPRLDPRLLSGVFKLDWINRWRTWLSSVVFGHYLDSFRVHSEAITGIHLLSAARFRCCDNVWFQLNRLLAYGPWRAFLHSWSLIKPAVCECGPQQTMNHIVDVCLLTKLEAGLQSPWTHCWWWHTPTGWKPQRLHHSWNEVQ